MSPDSTSLAAHGLLPLALVCTASPCIQSHGFPVCASELLFRPHKDGTAPFSLQSVTLCKEAFVADCTCFDAIACFADHQREYAAWLPLR